MQPATLYLPISPYISQALEISSDPATLRTLCSLQPYISLYLPISPYISQALEISSDLGASLRKLAAGWAVPTLTLALTLPLPLPLTLTRWAVPSLQPWGYQQSVATLGAVVMPHNLYLHSSLVLSRGPPLAQHQEVHAAICSATLSVTPCNPKC